MESRYHIGFEVHTLDRLIGQSFHALYDKENLTKIQSWIIRYLYDRRDEDVYQKDIEAIFHIARSTATGILQSLEKQGYLIRRESEHDARMKHLELTQKAVLLQESVLQNIEQTERILMKDITNEEIEAFLTIIRKMQQNLSPDDKKLCQRPWTDNEEKPST